MIFRLKLFIFTFCTIAGSAFAQIDLASMQSTLESMMKKAELDYLLGLQAMTPQYLGAISKYSEQAKAKGDLDALLELQGEEKRVANGLTKPDEISADENTARLQTTLKSKISELDAAKEATVEAAILGFLNQVAKIEKNLTMNGDIEGAVAARDAAKELRKRPEFAHISQLEIPGVSPIKWRVFYRSASAAAWNTNQLTETSFSRKLADLSDDSKYLRIAHLDSKEFVIIPIDIAQLQEPSAQLGGGYSWIAPGGASSYKHLGLQDRTRRSAGGMLGDSSYSGWGWGASRQDFSYEATTLNWNGNAADKGILEFALTGSTLSNGEEAFLLTKEAAAAPAAARPIIATSSSGLPAPIKGAHSLKLSNASLLGPARVSDDIARMGIQSQLEWPLAKIKQGNYNVYVTARRYSSSTDKGTLSAQGARDTSSTRGKVIVGRGNVVTQAVPYGSSAQRINMGTIQLGGFNKLQLIFLSNGQYDYATVYRVEIMPAR